MVGAGALECGPGLAPEVVVPGLVRDPEEADPRLREVGVEDQRLSKGSDGLVRISPQTGDVGLDRVGLGPDVVGRLGQASEVRRGRVRVSRAYGQPGEGVDDDGVGLRGVRERGEDSPRGVVSCFREEEPEFAPEAGIPGMSREGCAEDAEGLVPIADPDRLSRPGDGPPGRAWRRRGPCRCAGRESEKQGRKQSGWRCHGHDYGMTDRRRDALFAGKG